MRHRLKVLAKADRDVESIATWLKKRSPPGATRWLNAYHSALDRLADNPLAYAEAPESVRFDFVLRQILFKTPMGKRYRALFAVFDEEVRILRVRRPGQRPVRRRDVPQQ